jgi:hypothetical protein
MNRVGNVPEKQFEKRIESEKPAMRPPDLSRGCVAEIPECYDLWFVAGAPVSRREGARDLTAPRGISLQRHDQRRLR